MFKLLKEEVAQKNDLAKRLEDAGNKLTIQIAKFNNALEELYAPVYAAQTEYNELVTEASLFVSQIGEERQGEFDEKSETWQEGERGEQAGEWVDAYTSAEFEELDIEPVTGIADLDLEHSSTLMDLPE